MRMNGSIAKPSRKQLLRMKDYTDDDAPLRDSLGPGFWATAPARYPSRNRKAVRLLLDPEVVAWFNAHPEERDGANAVLRAYVESKKAERRAQRKPAPTTPKPPQITSR